MCIRDRVTVTRLAVPAIQEDRSATLASFLLPSEAISRDAVRDESITPVVNVWLLDDAPVLAPVAKMYCVWSSSPSPVRARP